MVILGLAGAGYALVQHYNGNIDRIPVFGAGARPGSAPHDAMNVLLVGTDSREGANAKGTGGKGFAPGQRADTIILAHLFGRSDKAFMLSIPRNSWIVVPTYTDPKTGRTHKAHHAQINSVLGQGGPRLLVATVEKLTNIRVDHYMQIDFVGFKNMVDKLGGVDICLPKDVNDPHSFLRLSAGRHHVNGKVALQFVRTRYSFARGDLDRITHQQQLIGAMTEKILSSKTLLNPFKLNGFLNAATSSLKIDETLKFGDLKNIALRMRGFSSGNVLFATVPVADASYRTPGGADVVLLDDSTAQGIYSSLRRDKAPGSPTTRSGTTSLIVKPSSIRVRVFNGSGVTGLARRVYRELGDEGFAMTGTPTNRGAGASTTYVLYGPNRRDSAQTLAAALPGAVPQEDLSLGRTLEVVVGSAFSDKHAQPVTVMRPPSPKPTPAVKVRSAADDICS